jgi:hypothetical protein
LESANPPKTCSWVEFKANGLTLWGKVVFALHNRPCVGLAFNSSDCQYASGGSLYVDAAQAPVLAFVCPFVQVADNDNGAACFFRYCRYAFQYRAYLVCSVGNDGVKIYTYFSGQKKLKIRILIKCKQYAH